MTDIDPSYWEPPDDDEAEDRFFDAFADVVREASPDFVGGRCPRCHGTPGQGHSATCGDGSSDA